MKKVLILTTKEGHLSIAQAVDKMLEQKGFITQTSNFLAKKTFKFYTPFYRYFPFLFKVPYKIGERDVIQKAVKIYVEKKLEKNIKDEVKVYQPDLIISTNPFYLPAVTKILDYQKSPIPCLNIIANPWAIHSLEFSQNVDFNLVYDDKGLKIGKKNKIPKEKIKIIGWLVRNRFYKTYKQSTMLKKLGFKKNVFTMLICGGSEGTSMILKIIPALFTLQKPLQVIVVCGTNKKLYKALKSFKKLLPQLKKTRINSLGKLHSRLDIKIFRFTNKLPQLINAADIVIGKAGPNLIFETVAQNKPFLAICHISGLEDANLNLIKKKKLGFVEENSLKVIKLLKQIIEKPKILEKFKPCINKERAYNKLAKEKLTNLVRQLVN